MTDGIKEGSMHSYVKYVCSVMESLQYQKTILPQSRKAGDTKLLNNKWILFHFWPIWTFMHFCVLNFLPIVPPSTPHAPCYILTSPLLMDAVDILKWRQEPRGRTRYDRESHEGISVKDARPWEKRTTCMDILALLLRLQLKRSINWSHINLK